jgi:hypothetical protein
MTPANQERLKGLLDVMVRRHARQGEPRHPVGQLIAEETRRLCGERVASTTAANREAHRLVVDRLYRRFLLPDHSTVEAFAEDDFLCDEMKS